MDIMLDLETFGLGSAPAIVQIGACFFTYMTDDQPVIDSTTANHLTAGPWGFNQVVNLQSSLLLGASIDQETVEWWKKQSKEARAAISGSHSVNIEEALHRFDQFFHSQHVDHIWSHGAASDVPWLEASYRLVGRTVPWKHTQVRDTRTLFWLAQKSGWERDQMTGVAHDALDDAMAQARDVRSAYKWLSKYGISENPNLPSD